MDRLSCRSFAANAVRLQLHALAYNLGNFLRTLATPEPIKDWSLTTLKERLIKIGAKIVSHGRYVAFQMAEVAIPRQMFQEILWRCPIRRDQSRNDFIDSLCGRPGNRYDAVSAGYVHHVSAFRRMENCELAERGPR